MSASKAYIVACGRLPLAPCSQPPVPEKGFPPKEGWYHNLSPVQMAAVCAQGVVGQLDRFNPNGIDQIITGCAMPVDTQNGNIGRLIALANDWQVPGSTLNHLCMSSMAAQYYAVALLTSSVFGSADRPQAILVVGVEKMSDIPMNRIFTDMTPDVIEILEPTAFSMGLTAEALAREYHLTRQELDEWALTENRRARSAIECDLFKKEIIPVELEGGTLERDVMPQELTAEMVARGKLYFDKEGVITQYTSSQMTDGAAGILFANKKAVDENGWTPLAEFIGGAVADFPPEVMGGGVLAAGEKFFQKTGFIAKDFRVQEINTAFAAVPLAWAKVHDVPLDWININGGATALGHPLGATGARLTVTGIHIAKYKKAGKLLVNMCVGLGQGGLGAYEVF